MRRDCFTTIKTSEQFIFLFAKLLHSQLLLALKPVATVQNCQPKDIDRQEIITDVAVPFIKVALERRPSKL
jgi:hypothetical protein